MTSCSRKDTFTFLKERKFSSVRERNRNRGGIVVTPPDQPHTDNHTFRNVEQLYTAIQRSSSTKSNTNNKNTTPNSLSKPVSSLSRSPSSPARFRTSPYHHHSPASSTDKLPSAVDRFLSRFVVAMSSLFAAAIIAVWFAACCYWYFSSTPAS